MDLPGVGKKDVGVTLHDGLLELIGERNWTPPKGWKAVNGDNESYSYRLRLMVGDRVEEGSISAETINGVLRLTLPKEEEKRRARSRFDNSLRGLGWRRFSGEGTGAFLLEGRMARPSICRFRSIEPSIATFLMPISSTRFRLQ